MEAFDKKRCLDNIYFLAKQKSIKIGDLEAAANVSAGYLSRANKEDNTSKLTIDLIAAIAQTLEISIDRLVSYDLSGLSPNERRIIAFVEKLIRDTADGAVDWEKKEPAAVGSIECYGDGTTSDCLYLCKNQEPYYHSYFFPGHLTRQSGESYTYDMDEGTRIILTKVHHDDAQGDDFELYFLIWDDYSHNSSMEPVCGTSPTKETSFDALLKHFYDTVADSCRNVKLSPLVRNIINRYMGDQPDNHSNDDGELPF
jgi:transcriptional regulator with XRE-family HTH domain